MQTLTPSHIITSPLRPSRRRYKQPGLHIDLTQLGHTTTQLQQGLHALQDPHMRKANLADKLQAGMFTERRDGLGDAEHGTDDIVAGIAQSPQVVQGVQGGVDFPLPAGLDHGLHLDRVGRVHDAEDVVAAHEAEAGPGRLQVVDGLAHVALGAEDEGGQAVVGVLDALGVDDLEQALHHLGVAEAGVAQDGAAGLERFDDFVRLVAREGEARGAGVDFHGAAESLLRAGRHA